MTYSKIVNPKTGRKVSTSGRLGKEILRNYFFVLSGGKKPSSSSDYLPPEHLFYKDQLDNYGAETIDCISPKHYDYNEIVTFLTDPASFHPNPSTMIAQTNNGVRLSPTAALKKDVEEIIKHAWTRWYNNQTKVSPKIAYRLWAAGINTNI